VTKRYSHLPEIKSGYPFQWKLVRNWNEMFGAALAVVVCKSKGILSQNQRVVLCWKVPAKNVEIRWQGLSINAISPTATGFAAGKFIENREADLT
jgi:hypothetical protein